MDKKINIYNTCRENLVWLCKLRGVEWQYATIPELVGRLRAEDKKEDGRMPVFNNDVDPDGSKEAQWHQSQWEREVARVDLINDDMIKKHQKELRRFQTAREKGRTQAERRKNVALQILNMRLRDSSGAKLYQGADLFVPNTPDQKVETKRKREKSNSTAANSHGMDQDGTVSKNGLSEGSEKSTASPETAPSARYSFADNPVEFGSLHMRNYSKLEPDVVDSSVAEKPSGSKNSLTPGTNDQGTSANFYKKHLAEGEAGIINRQGKGREANGRTIHAATKRMRKVGGFLVDLEEEQLEESEGHRHHVHISKSPSFFDDSKFSAPVPLTTDNSDITTNTAIQNIQKNNLKPSSKSLTSSSASLHARKAPTDHDAATMGSKLADASSKSKLEPTRGDTVSPARSPIHDLGASRESQGNVGQNSSKGSPSKTGALPRNYKLAFKIEGKIKGKPYLKLFSPSIGRMLSFRAKQTEGSFREYHPSEIRVDTDAIYIIFPKTPQGIKEMNTCYARTKPEAIFPETTFKLERHNPNLEEIN